MGPGSDPNFASEVGIVLRDSIDRAEATAFVTGSGSGEPTGIITELDGGSSELAPATAEVFAVADVWSTAEALPERAWSSPSCAWVAHRGTQFAIRQFADGASQGAGAFWVDFGKGNPSHLLGKAIHDSSVMDNSSDINPAASEDNFVLLVGDWSRYVIVDRVGISIELVSHTFATGANRPDGGRGYYAYKRTGAASIDDGAFRVMSIPTTA